MCNESIHPIYIKAGQYPILCLSLKVSPWGADGFLHRHYQPHRHAPSTVRFFLKKMPVIVYDMAILLRTTDRIIPFFLYRQPFRHYNLTSPTTYLNGRAPT